MLNPAQQKRLAQIDRDMEEACFSRQNYTDDNSPRGYAEWQRLWDLGISLWNERQKLLQEESDAKS